MAKSRRRFSRSRTVRGKPDMQWLTIAGVEGLDDSSTVTGVPLLIPTDWQTNEQFEGKCTLVKLVYTHFIEGASVGAIHAWSGLYAVCKTSDVPPSTVPPNLLDPAAFAPFFATYDECLHWGNFTAMPFSAAVRGMNVRIAGGAMAAMPENMLNLQNARKMGGGDAIHAFYPGVTAAGVIYQVFWHVRALIRAGLR